MKIKAKDLRVAFFSTGGDDENLESKINEWLEKQKENVIVHDIKFADRYIHAQALVLYTEE